MTKWDWIRSGVILTITVFMFENFFISLTYTEAIILALFQGVVIFHMVDVREDLLARLFKYRKKRDAKRKEES